MLRFGEPLHSFPAVHRLALVLAALAPALEVERVTTGPLEGTSELIYTELLASSDDGRRAIFETYEKLTSDDVHTTFDFYANEGGETTLQTRFGGAHEQFVGVSADARRILFNAHGVWTPDDADGAFDVYTASGGVVERVSLGPNGGNDPDLDAFAAGISRDGRRVLFETAEALTADDGDHRKIDVFLRSGGATVKLTEGSGEFDAEHVGHSADARTIVFSTVERLTPGDADDRADLYLRSAAGTVKVSPGDGPFDVQFHAISDDGTTVAFSTQERLTADDTDQRSDLYRWRAGSVLRVSTGPLGGNSEEAAVGNDLDPSIPDGWVQLMADDGERIAFLTRERLTADDTDQWDDDYVWTRAGVRRVSTGARGGNGAGNPWVYAGSRDGRSLVFGAEEQITADDRDDRSDLFVREGRVTRRVTTGPAGGNGPFNVTCLVRPMASGCPALAFASADGAAVFFTTNERLVRADRDDAIDVYRRAGGETILLSPALPGRPSADVWFVDAAEDGSIAYVQTEERLTADDTNIRNDGYRVRLPVPLVTARPRALRLARGATRLARRGPGIPLVMPRRGTLEVRVKRLRSRRAVRVRLRARGGRQVLLLGAARLRPGRHRVVLATGDSPPARLTVRLRRRAAEAGGPKGTSRSRDRA
jgi:hypothetical protein